MHTKILWIFLLLFTCSTYADDNITVISDREISVDLSKYDVPTGNFKKAAMKAFIGRHWDITSVEKSSVTGKLSERDNYSRVEINYSQAPTIHLKYIDNDKDVSTSYLINLKRDMLDKLLSCM